MKKKIANKLKALSENLGEIKKQVMVEVPIMGWELLLTGFGKQPIAKTIKPDSEYMLKIPEIHYFSPEKELKRQYKQNGTKGVATVVRGEINKRKT
jgi:hypothetical protein